MNALIVAAILFASRPAFPGEEGARGAGDGVEKASELPTARFKTPDGQLKFQQGLKKVTEEDYPGARDLFVQCQKEAIGPEDRKVVQDQIEDLKVGPEIEAAKALVAKKEERSAIAKLEKAIREHPRSLLRPKAEKVIREAEEVIYLILDDFEDQDGLPEPAENQNAKKRGRAGGDLTFNSDPQYVRHGKGSAKWRLGGAPAGRKAQRNQNQNQNQNHYLSAELKNPITRWSQLVFWVHLPEEDEGVLQVLLAPRADAGRESYGQKLIDLHGKRGWMEVKLDLKKDFGAAHTLKIEEVRYVLITSLKPKTRTIYLDFVHLE